MSLDTKKANQNWQNDLQNQVAQWEFYKTTQGQWNWRLITPEGWNYNKNQWEQNAAWNDKTWNAAISNSSNWNSLKNNIDWVEVSRSPEGYSSKTDCQTNAKQNGWNGY